MRWQQQPQTKVIHEIERELPKVQPNFLAFECIYGPHKADLLHRGTAYCRQCYDAKNPFGTLIDP
jgi:hypothetical protein